MTNLLEKCYTINIYNFSKIICQREYTMVIEVGIIKNLKRTYLTIPTKKEIVMMIVGYGQELKMEDLKKDMGL